MPWDDIQLCSSFPSALVSVCVNWKGAHMHFNKVLQSGQFGAGHKICCRQNLSLCRIGHTGTCVDFGLDRVIQKNTTLLFFLSQQNVYLQILK